MGIEKSVMNSHPTLFSPDPLPYPVPTEELCIKLNAYETDAWVIPRLMEIEYPMCLNTAKRAQTIRVLDPCYGLGMITRTILKNCPNAFVYHGDLINWTDRPHFNQGDFLSPESADWIKQWTGKGLAWDCIMNPPFSHSTQFIDRAIELGARKICVLEKNSFIGSKSRKAFWDKAPLTKILYCAERANCKRFDLKDQNLSSTTHDHSWFIFEPYAKRIPNNPELIRIYK